MGPKNAASFFRPDPGNQVSGNSRKAGRLSREAIQGGVGQGFAVIRLSIDPQGIGADSLHAALEVLQSGGIVAYPTESSYGLGADVLNKAAWERIYEIKSRNPKHPLPVLVPRADYPQSLGTGGF